MNILITGGAGYIGNELAYNLCIDEEVHKIVIYDNLSRKNFNLFTDKRIMCKKLRFVSGDVIDTPKLKKELADIDVVYHLAGLVSSGAQAGNTFLNEQLNRWGTLELINALVGSQVKKLFYLSSASIYGFSDLPFDEGSLADPVSNYAKSKYAGEKLVESLRENMDFFLLRLANVYGYSPCIRYEPLINRLMFEACYAGSISIKGHLGQTRSFVTIDKVVNILVNMMKMHASPGVYNVVEYSLSLHEIAEEFKRLFPDLLVVLTEKDSMVLHRIVNNDERLNPLISLPTISFNDTLTHFRDKLLQAHSAISREAV
jgi:UDP-glucose 4-epimerase